MSNILSLFILIYITNAVEGIDNKEYPLYESIYIILYVLIN